ncbi:amiloride-sensitive sodium channel subunit gamma-2-like isoform X2 [Bufo gargarizans]|nr:amiloride-sensitive sodium channel subunit gamma isoform X2 [Bufo gargarizans]XP_044160819.1 amiloride-sensitive sodium channel subunit gamma-2-like isoform X2 [Bufo gargarizans]
MSNGPKKKLTQKLKKTLPVTGPQAPTLYELMQWYCMTTNTHGCRRIVVSKGRLRKWIWIALTLTAVALIFWQCALLIMSYYSVSVSITVNFQKLTFPAVTVCNMNPYKYSVIRPYLLGLEKDTLQYLKELYGYTESSSRRRRDLRTPQNMSAAESDYFSKIRLFPVKSINDNQVGTEKIATRKRSSMDARVAHRNAEITDENIVGYKLCDPNNSTDCTIFTFSSATSAIQEWYRLHYMNILAKIPMEKKIDMGYSADELLINCLFDGKPCDARNFTLFNHSLYGNCYTFNDAQQKQLLESSMGGSEAGLNLIIYIDEEDYNPFLVTAAGAKILVHDQNDFPFIEESGTELETATETSIGMHLTESTKLSSPYSECTIDGSDVPIQNLYNKKYTFQICLYSCFQIEMVKTCGCAHHDHPLPQGAQYCNFDEMPSWIYCYFKLHRQFVEEELGCQSTCRETCSFKEWTFTRSVAKWPSISAEEWTLRVLSWELGSRINKNLTKNDLANLDIFYQDLNLRTIAESPSSSLTNLLSNVGGQLGLWMSCSMVCVLEIVEIFLIDSFWVVLRPKWQKLIKWWKTRKQEDEELQHPDSMAGHDNPGLTEEDPPTFNTALHLPHVDNCQVPRTPPPLYRSLQIQSTFSGHPVNFDDEIEEM